MNALLVDAGNTKIKCEWILEGGARERFEFSELREAEEFIRSCDFQHGLISSTRGAWAPSDKLTVVHAGLNLPISIKYMSPDTLGSDRIAAACGAEKSYPNRNRLIVDLGSCITYDLLDRDANYWGGAISPGVNMRFKAMNAFTGSLPLEAFEPSQEVQPLGRNTANCLKSGVINGIIFEIEGFSLHYQRQFGDLVIILTGGNSKIFESKIKAPIFVASNLVMVGLNSILEGLNESTQQ